MNYLFFDIECANCDHGKGKICSFGYVLTDSDFNTIKEDDILVNPDAPFHLTGRRDKRDIKLGYPTEKFLSSPKFPEKAQEIFALLEDKNVMVFGYAVINDVNFLIAEGERYDLTLPNFDYYDVQLIYSDYKSVRNVVSLERASAEFGVEVNEEHISLNDAKDTMTVAKGICNRLGLSLEEVVKLSYRAKGRLEKGEKTPFGVMPKRREYNELRDKIFALSPSTDSSILKERANSFDIFGGEKRILHNYDSGVKNSSTIGELLKGISINYED